MTEQELQRLYKDDYIPMSDELKEGIRDDMLNWIEENHIEGNVNWCRLLGENEWTMYELRVRLKD